MVVCSVMVTKTVLQTMVLSMCCLGLGCEDSERCQQALAFSACPEHHVVSPGLAQGITGD